MIGNIVSTIVIALESAQIECTQEEKILAIVSQNMTAEQFDTYIKDRNKRKEKQEAEAAEDRRFNQLCEAIRSTSFWRFGR